jgi:hypothetical protein
MHINRVIDSDNPMSQVRLLYGVFMAPACTMYQEQQ